MNKDGAESEVERGKLPKQNELMNECRSLFIGAVSVTISRIAV
jgi:hypothetical protein